MAIDLMHHNFFTAGRNFCWAVCLAIVLGPSPLRGDVTISEFVAGGANGFRDEDGQGHDWIEIQNRGPNPVDLRGWSLTDDRDNSEKWTFPPRILKSGQFLVVFASGKNRRAPAEGNNLHTNFRLNAFGEYLALFNAESPRIAATEFAPKYPEQRNRYSYGLDGTNTWRYLQIPTPGASNGISSILGIAPAPQFSVGRGKFDGPVTLRLSTALEGASIRYTTNGSEPTATSGLVYEAPLRITNTTTLRAATFKHGYLPSRPQTHSYIFLDQVLNQPKNPPGFPSSWGASSGFPDRRVPADYEMDLDPLRVDPNSSASPIDAAKLRRFKDGLRELPIVSVAMRTEDMFGPGGLYPKAREAAKLSNEKACSVEMVLPDGTSAFAVTCGIDLHGNASRNPMKNPKHGFKLAFKGEFGESVLRYRLFPDSPADVFDDLILRPDFGVSWRHWSDSFGNEQGNLQRSRGVRTRDAWFKDTLRDMGGTASYNRFCHLFINGLYWGTYDITEQPTDSFARNYFGGAAPEYDVYDQGSLRSGTAKAYHAMLSIGDLGNNTNYELMTRLLHVPAFIDYMLLHFFIGHQDWGYHKNWYAIRRRVAGPAGTFRFVPWDGESLLLDEDIDRVSNPDVPAGLHTKLLENAEYRLAFADAVFKHMLVPGGALSVTSNVARWRKWQAILDKPIVAESVRWGDYRRDVHRFNDGRFVLYTRESHWLPENDRIANSYLANRNAIVLRQLRAAGLYPAVEAPAFNQQGGQISTGFNLTMSARKGTIYYTTNGVDPRLYGTGEVSPKAAVYKGAPVPLANTVVIKARVLSGRTWSAVNEALFTTGHLGIPLRITEIMYHPANGDACEFLKLMNVGSVPLDASQFRFRGIDYIFPDRTILQPGVAVLLSSSANTNTFARSYPAAVVFGNFRGSLDNGGERIAILDRHGHPVTSVQYDDENGWPASADGGGSSLEMIDLRGNPNAPDNWRARPGP
ncbi:MAG: lamin tail domain-containing protein [Verrucomicrobiales bacterium]|nr:lamin tail domain-containing protein [Verrucomicrobiales bacterium]